ncbi:MAG: sodium-dependent bicarbonate transport family permease [Gammaproteobacteria bacterium]|nr:sodium-dependent bicarbonate transport family permease [Gammaproteobacteria bacterium]
MDSFFLTNLSSPPLLFFFLGAAAVFVRSDLEIPTQIAKFLSLYLLFAIGFKGGVALAESELDATVGLTIAASLLLACVVPVYVFFLLQRRMPVADAAAIAATYGSISAVTFVTCTSYLDAAGIPWGGHLVAAMALMESPAIIIGILLYRLYRNGTADTDGPIDWADLLKESCLNGSVFLIVGSLLIGWFTGPTGMAQISPFVADLFIGVLCLFLLDMGIVAARRLQDLRHAQQTTGLGPTTLIGASLALPLVNAALAGAIALLLGLPEGDALLLTILGASASYIAVPAAMRLALPEANPSTYLPMSLAVTFPFNLLIGIPAYHYVLRLLTAN